jgi:hypothetical protein
VITNIEAKKEQQYKDIMELKVKQEKPNNGDHFGIGTEIGWTVCPPHWEAEWNAN